MQKIINSNLFNFSFFLSDRKKVASLENGAKENGGSTKFEKNIYSNYAKNEYIKIKNNNEISIFIPSTMEVSKNIDNKYFVEKAITYLQKFYNIDNLKYYKTMGSWYSDDLQKVIIEDITIITLKTIELSEIDINIFIDLANIIKTEMKQEGVSISINNSLAIV